MRKLTASLGKLVTPPVAASGRFIKDAFKSPVLSG
jgi:hypothetical protein